jgi:hypothetical protein
VTGSGRRRSAAGLARVQTPHGVLALHRVDGAFPFAVRATLAMALAALPAVATGHPDLAVYAMLGSFTTTFGRTLPYDRRARVLAVVAVAMTTRRRASCGRRASIPRPSPPPNSAPTCCWSGSCTADALA